MNVTLTTMLTWTTHPPTRGGYYWARLPETDRPQIVWIHIVKWVGHPPLLLVFPAGMDAVYPSSRVMAWAGPIPEPEAPL
jgi:hypothetical protein